MKKYLELLIGNQEEFSFEHRTFNTIMLLAMIVTLFGAVLDAVVYDLYINIYSFIAWSILYWGSRIKRKYDFMSVIAVIFLVYIFIPVNWISTDGIADCIPYYTMVCTVTLCMLLKGKMRLFLSGSMVVIVIILIYYDVFKGRVTPYNELVLGRIGDHNKFILGAPPNSIHLVISLIAIIFMMIAYSNLYMREKSRNEAYAKVIKEQNKQQVFYMENLEEIIYKLKSERHDYNNHLGVVYSLLETNDIKSARSYTTQLVETVKEYRNIVMIDYPMIRAMLNYKLSVFKEHDIELRLNINVPPNLGLSPYDLTVILGNLLDNAFEANIKLDQADRYFDMKLVYNPNYLVIKIINPVNLGGKFADGTIKTTKMDQENHGFGLKNIEFLVNKHNGYMELVSDENKFEVHIALLIE